MDKGNAKAREQKKVPLKSTSRLVSWEHIDWSGPGIYGQKGSHMRTSSRVKQQFEQIRETNMASIANGVAIEVLGQDVTLVLKGHSHQSN